MIEDVLQAVLEKADGFAGKVYKLAAPKNAVPTYIVYGKADETELQDMDGATGIWMGRLELHVLAANYAELKRAEQTVKAACRSAEETETAGVHVFEMRARVSETEEALPNTKLEHSELEVQAQWQAN